MQIPDLPDNFSNDVWNAIKSAGVLGSLLFGYLFYAERKDSKEEINSLLADLREVRKDTALLTEKATVAMTKMETTLTLLAQIFSSKGST